MLKVKEAVPPEGVNFRTLLPEAIIAKLLPLGISAIKVRPETVIELASESERTYKVVSKPDKSIIVSMVKWSCVDDWLFIKE